MTCTGSATVCRARVNVETVALIVSEPLARNGAFAPRRRA
jgi:hypothetical protein